MSLDAIVVLGCRVEGLEHLSAAAARRVEYAALAYRQGLAPRVIASGGKRWHGVTEAAAFSERLCALGVPRADLLLEERSLTTVQNARYVAHLARAQSLRALCVVTCDWHMARAVQAFRYQGLLVLPYPAYAPATSTLRGKFRTATERLRALADRVVIALEPAR